MDPKIMGYGVLSYQARPGTRRQVRDFVERNFSRISNWYPNPASSSIFNLN
jgi:hypothetical protein